MKYAHLADLHLGSWREEKMRELSTRAFLQAIDECMAEKVDFLLFSGNWLKLANDVVSPSGKTMLEVLENAGLLKNVCKGGVDPESKKLKLKFTIDEKTGAKITGMLGKKGLLDKVYYQNLELESLEKEQGYKIFLFHTTLTELKPPHLAMMEGQPLSFLPKNFNYYAGGHVHHPTLKEEPGYGTLTYPGALFPNNFAELEKYGKGGYYLVSVEDKEQNRKQEITWKPVEVIKYQGLILQCQHKTAAEVTKEILQYFSGQDLQQTLITLRLNGTLEQGKVGDIDFKTILEQLTQQGAYFIMKNTSQLVSREFAEIKLASRNPERMEEEIIREHLGQSKIFSAETELKLIQDLLQTLNTTKKEGETVSDFQNRVEEEMQRMLNL